MVFRDQRLVCEECGKTFFFTVTDQRRLAAQVGEENVEVPRLCPACQRPVLSPPPARSAHAEPVERVERVKRAERVERVEPVERVQRAEQVERVESAEEIEEPRDRGRNEPVIQVDDFPLEEEGIELKLIGEVKWFNLNKGYGFITMAGGEDVFFHRSDVEAGQLSQLRDGTQVEFQVRRTDKGMEAFNVSLFPPR